jgi:hypothetical protein
MTHTESPPARPAFAVRALRFAAHEFREMVPPTVFFAVGFNLVVLSMNLVLSDYLIRLGNFLLITAAALVVGKAVLVANAMPFLRRFDRAPLIQPILFKSVIYWAFVFIARLLEGAINYVMAEGQVAGLGGHIAATFSWHRFLFVQLWILVLFLIYVTASEVNRLLGDGRLFALFFRHGHSERQQTRRERVRALVRLGDLTERHSAAQLADPRSPGHAALRGLLADLTRPASRRAAPPGAGAAAS